MTQLDRIRIALFVTLLLGIAATSAVAEEGWRIKARSTERAFFGSPHPCSNRRSIRCLTAPSGVHARSVIGEALGLSTCGRTASASPALCHTSAP